MTRKRNSSCLVIVNRPPLALGLSSQTLISSCLLLQTLSNANIESYIETKTNKKNKRAHNWDSGRIFSAPALSRLRFSPFIYFLNRIRVYLNE